MRVLVACEFSGRVREAFAGKGFDAWSCDIEPSLIPGNHIQDDVRNVLNDGWDMMIAFPPCENLACSGAAHWDAKKVDGRMRAAIEFFMTLAEAPIPRICVENPKGVMSRAWRLPDQCIQPYEHGEPYVKGTFLWLNNLPLLKPTNVVHPHSNWVGGQRRGKERRYVKGNGRHRNPKLRALTFQGIADAMAQQWGVLEPLSTWDCYSQPSLL